MSGFERMVYRLMAIPRLPLLVLFSLLGLCAGLFCAFRPHQAIEFQKRFYARINWRMEPISMEKEIANTRFMGWFLILVSLVPLFLAANKMILL